MFVSMGKVMANTFFFFVSCGFVYVVMALGYVTLQVLNTLCYLFVL